VRCALCAVRCALCAVSCVLCAVRADASRRLHASGGESARLLTFVLIGQMSGGLVGGLAKDTLSGRAVVLASLLIKARS
jgi:hypothetical protein